MAKKLSQSLVTPSKKTKKKQSQSQSSKKKALKDVTTAKNKKQPEPVTTPAPESEGEEDVPAKDSGKVPVTHSAFAPVVTASAAAAVATASPKKKKKALKDVTTSKNKKQPEPVTIPVPESEGEEDVPVTHSAFVPVVTASTSAAAVASASPKKKKRQSEGGAASTEVNPSKRVQTEAANKGLFQRVWTEEDEVVLLQGIIDFRSNTGTSYLDDTKGFFQTVKNSLSFEVKDMNQFTSKIWSLRKKYLAKRKNGVEPSFRKPHDNRCLQLAKIIWGMDVEDPKKKKKKKKMEVKIDAADVDVEADWFEKSFLVSAVKNFGVLDDESNVREKWTLVPLEVKKMIKEKFKSWNALELNALLLKTDLVNDVCHACYP